MLPRARCAASAAPASALGALLRNERALLSSLVGVLRNVDRELAM